jgi:lysozyme family protein
MNFDTAFDRLLGSEGGYTPGINDPGGETKWGISKRSYPHLNIKDLTREQAKDIYRADFWERIHADAMPYALAFQTFDFAVNSGIGTAVRYLQRALGVASDGYIGPVTLATLASSNNAEVVLRLLALRLDYMTRLSTWNSFGMGWSRRIAADMLFAAGDV